MSRLFPCLLISAVLAGAPAAVRPAAPVDAVPPPLDWSVSAPAIAASCKAEIARADAAITALPAAPAHTFATIVLPLETITADLNDRTAADMFLTQVSDDKAVRDASLQCGTDEQNFLNAVSARPALYAALHDAQTSTTAQTEADKKLTDLWVRQSFRAGAGLSDAKRAEFVADSARLTDLQNQFGAELANESMTISIRRDQTRGLPPDFVATFHPTATGYLVPVNESTFFPFITYAGDARARHVMFSAFFRRGGPRNVARLQQAIAIRDRLAHLFGYSTWAAYQLDDRMAQNPQRVNRFLNDIDAAILPKAKLQEAEFSRQKGGPIEPSDAFYYMNRLRQTRYAVDEVAIKQYFPVQHTVDAVLGVYAKLLGVTFVKMDQPSVWNAEVVGYTVHDQDSGALLGQFYLDLFPRTGKYSHFASFNVVPRRVLPDGTVRAPVNVIVGNWSRPARSHPATLGHDEVVIFFHEFGHNMAAMLGTQPYETLNNGFRLDFVEAPSQMLENWVWDPAILKEISANVTTGAPLPDDVIRKMVAARYVDYTLEIPVQISYAAIDMAYHSSGPRVDTTAVFGALTKRYTGYRWPSDTYAAASFTHMMSGYDAGYYGYLWSQVYAQDMFTAFKAGGLESPVVGRRYRDDILAPARLREPDAEVAAFLGRPMSPTAFYRELGIGVPQAAAR